MLLSYDADDTEYSILMSLAAEHVDVDSDSRKPRDQLSAPNDPSLRQKAENSATGRAANK